MTFLFTDIEGSTRLWEEQPDTMSVELKRHDTIIREAIEANGGHVFKRQVTARSARSAMPRRRCARLNRPNAR